MSNSTFNPTVVGHSPVIDSDISFTTPVLGSPTATQLTIGTPGYTPANPTIIKQKNVNSYTQAILQNTNSGTTASADFIVNNDLSTDSTYYGDFGINSSGFTGTGSLSLANATYLTATSGDLVLGTTTSNGIHFAVNSSATDAMSISNTGIVSLGTPLSASSGGTGISSLGTGVATALGNNIGSAGAFITFNGGLGTPSSGTLTNCTGLPITGIIMNTARLLGRTTASSGAVEEITAGSSMSLSGGSLNTVQNIQTSASPQFAEVNIGNASDTTITRSSGGIIAVEGVEIRPTKYNASTSSQSSTFSSDTYLAGSFITFPYAPRVGTTYKLVFDVTKTAAGTATPIITVRMGTAGTTSDTSRVAFTFGAGTAAADTGIFEVIVTFRSVGSGTSAVAQGICRLTSNLTTTGLSNAVKARATTSSGFDSTTANLGIGVSYNGGASASHTVNLVRAELVY